MKNFFLLLILFFISVAGSKGAAGIDSLQIKKVAAITDSVKKLFAPDKRTVLFSTEITSSDPLALKVETSSREALPFFKELLKKENVQAVIEESILPSAELNGKIYGVAGLSVCNNRLMPENASEMVSQTLLGTPVEILKKSYGYYLVRTPDQYISWTDDAGIAVMDKPAFDQWRLASKIVFTANYGHSYSKASQDSLPVSDLVAGNILKLTGKKKNFYQVTYPDGRIAYIPKKQTEPYDKWISRPNPDAEQIINTAKTLIGVPYLWGGTSIKGVDCSGFTKTSYYLNGVILARDASQQALTGEKIDIFEKDTVNIEKCLKNLKAGDLLFFSAGKARGKGLRVTHTAIYMGNGEFIQAAGLVKISSLLKDAANYDNRQTQTLVSARRILTAIGTPGISRIDQHTFYQTELK